MYQFKDLDEFSTFIKGRRVVVMGLGLQGGGVDSAQFFARLQAKVLVTDLKTEEQLADSLKQLKPYDNISYVLGRHRLQDFIKADLVIKNPVVPWDNKYLKAAKSNNAWVLSSVDLFFLLAKTKNIIGVTGTRGKSTVSSMIYSFLKNKLPSYLLGNVPNSQTLQTLFKLKPGDWVVMELSSWMLSGLHNIKKSPKYAVFTSFYPDHLNYYATMQDYFYDKSAVFSYQSSSDYLIANRQIQPYLSKYKLNSNVLLYSGQDFPYKPAYLLGKHNQTNSAGVFRLLVDVFKYQADEVVKFLVNFKPIAFRLEVVKKVGNLTFVNDSTSTTPTALLKAVSAFSEKNFILIMGGNSKGLPYDNLIKHLAKAKKIYLLPGSFTEEILPKLRLKYPDKVSANCTTLESVLTNIKQNYLGKEKDYYVLFSPGATSFAQFNNEFDRGRVFNQLITKIF